MSDVNLTVTDTKQYIATEGYPHDYVFESSIGSCYFHFMAPPGRRFIVTIEDFNTSGDDLYFRK